MSRLGVGPLALILLAGVPVAAQTRVEFHLLPAVSSGPLDPAFSPDGRHLVFAMRGDIWTVPVAGGEAVALTQGPAYHFEPRFSPDGSRVALTLDVGGNLDIGVVAAEGGAVERLTSDPEIDFEPTWSPDGASLYFVSRRRGNLDIYRLDLDSGAETLVVGTDRHDFQPAISPDGRALAYVSPVPGRLGSGGLWVQPLPAGEPELVHYEETSYRAKPEWSPDGSALTYSSDDAGSNDIAVVPARGGNRVRLTVDGFDEFDPAISPDGATIAFVSNRGGSTALHTLSSAGGATSAWRSVAIEARRPRFATGRLLGVVRGPGGEVVPARLMLVGSDGRGYVEDSAFHRMVPATRRHYQHTSGAFDVEVPAGRTRVEAMRGFEHLPAQASVDVPAGGVAEVELRLTSLLAAPQQGWYSGDMHVHDLHEGRYGLTHEAFFDQVVADDLHVTNALIHMDGTRLMGRWGDLSGAIHPLSNRDYILRYSQEFRGSFGHVALIGASEFIMPLIGGAANTPYAPDTLALRHIDDVRARGGIAGFVHPYNQAIMTPEDAATADIPVHVALGRGDFYDVLSVASLEDASASVYYKLLNCGFRLAATGGTDNFSDVWSDPSGGAARTYARVEGPLEFGSWVAAVAAGRSFGTNGPLLFLDVAGRQPGDEIAVGASDPGSFHVRVELASIAPVERVDLLVNGEVARSWRPAGTGPRWQLEGSVDVPGSGWVAARAVGPPSPYVGDAHAFAQTSPVYVVRDGVTFTSPADARFLLESVQALWRRVEARDSWHTTEQKEACRIAVDQARGVYRRILLAHPGAPAFSEPAPAVSRVRLRTSQGDVVIALFREWSPHGVDRFYNLVRFGYYDGVRFSRVREDFAQFGIQGEPEIAKAWRGARIPDDPVRASNRRGRVAFAMGHEPDDRTTQLYINLVDKTELDEMGFAPVGEVVEGLSVADALYSGYGETAGGGIRGGRQDPLFEGGNAYLDAHYPELDYIIEARVEEVPALRPRAP